MNVCPCGRVGVLVVRPTHLAGLCDWCAAVVWVLDLLGYQDGDQIDDLFPGTGSMGRAVTIHESRLAL